MRLKNMNKFSPTRFTKSSIAVVITNLALAIYPNVTFGETTLSGSILLEDALEDSSFGYDGEIGLNNWANLDPEWSTCGDGSLQSPINIRRHENRKRGKRLDLQYYDTNIEVLNNGHTIELKYEPGSEININGQRYELKQFHFHTPSEHTFAGGAHFPLEMHLVHSSADGSLAVVGVMIRTGRENRALPDNERFEQLIPQVASTTYSFDDRINVEDLLPKNMKAYAYSGSLTTPPCSEGVSWFVMKQSVRWSEEQVSILTNALGRLSYASEDGNNNRPIQPRNGRDVKLR